jgi:HEAT repeat protein
MPVVATDPRAVCGSGARRHAARALGLAYAVAIALLASACHEAVTSHEPDPALALEGDVYARRRAVDELVARGPAALPVVARALDDPSPDVRVAAVQVLVRLTPPALPLLGRALRDRAAVVREPATIALLAAGAAALPQFEEALASPDHYVRENAVGAVAVLGAGALPVLQRALGDPDRRVRRRAVQSLAALGPDALPALRALDTSGDAGLREDVERVLQQLESADARA